MVEANQKDSQQTDNKAKWLASQTTKQMGPFDRQLRI